MIADLRISEDTLLNASTPACTRLIVVAEHSISVLLPPPTPGRKIIILLMTEHSVSVVTNSKTAHFVIVEKPKTITISGTPNNYGKSLELETFSDNWLIRQTPAIH